ncbi:HD domain-containing protein [Micromonospora chalcea]|uniref:HD domain-containing protein n=1 Tax=Micromonospora chalcea TaxID=1874 RepID=UPI00331986A6
MDLILWAQRLAELKLAGQLERRWQHVQAVAAKAFRIKDLFDVEDRSIFVAAAWLHDIGYSPDLVVTGLHALDGARWLRKQGAGERLANLVAFHSCAMFEAEERGLVGPLRSEFEDEESPVRDALWWADMTTGPDGQDMTAHERLAEVRTRYGPGHTVTRFWARAEPVLMGAVQRTEELLADARRQPM